MVVDWGRLLTVIVGGQIIHWLFERWRYRRSTKLQALGFDVLPNALKMLHEAIRRTQYLVGFQEAPRHSSLAFWLRRPQSSPVVFERKETPDLRNMADHQFREFVTASRLRQSEREELLTVIPVRERMEYYSGKIAWIELQDAVDAHVKLNDYLNENRELMEAALAEAFQSASLQLASVNMEYRTYMQDGSDESLEEARHICNMGLQQIRKIEHMIKKNTLNARAGALPPPRL